MPTLPSAFLIIGPESVLAERGLAHTLQEISHAEPDAEVVRLSAAAYTPGDLGIHASPSLFGGQKVLVVHDTDEGSDELFVDLMDVLPAATAGDIRLIVLHKGGVRGKRATDALRCPGHRCACHEVR